MKSSLALFTLALTVGFAPRAFTQTSDSDGAHAVFVMSNSASSNQVLAYRRAKNGLLELSGHFATGDRGSGGQTDPLGSQGSLVLSEDRSLLFAMNAGSGDISVFEVAGPRLSLVDQVPSGGSAPVAIAQHNDLVYVLNFAGNSNVVGFRLHGGGQLTQIPNSIRYLTTANSGASSLAFSPDGRFLLVTEKLTNNIDVFPLQSDGTLSPVVVTHDPSPGTFAVTFAADGAALVVETGPAGATNASTISSYLVEAAGTLTPISAGVPTLGAGTCWHAITPDDRFVYTSNSATSSLSGFMIGGAGTLTPLSGTVVGSLPAGSTNLDIAISDDGKFLYTLDTGNGTLGIFAIQQDGTLTAIGAVGGISAKAGFNGIAAF
jgi:6-phosphogluconolactonase